MRQIGVLSGIKIAYERLVSSAGLEENMNWLKNIFKKIGRNVIIYGETKTGHTFPSYEKYLEYKIKQQ